MEQQLKKVTDAVENIKKADPKALRLASDLAFIGGFASIAASIAIWSIKRTDDASHAERFGIFVGLWAPTFFILSNRLERYADEAHTLKEGN